MHHTVKRLMVCEQPEDSESNEKQRYEYTQTPCHLAASAIEWSFRDQWTLVEHLKPNAIAEDGDGADLQDVSRHTLAAAAYLEKNGLVTQLLSNENIDLRGETYFGRFLECAAKSGNTEILSRFLSSSDIEFYNSLYFTPLSPAASAGHSSTVSLLLSPQYDIITKGAPYEKAIESAAGKGHTDIVIYLLDHSTEEASKKQELVHWIFCLAGHNNHPDLLLWALENGANINGRVKHFRDEIPLSWAASRGHNDIVRPILAKGANQHARRPHQPLPSAVTNGFASTVMLLIDDHIAGRGGGTYRDFFNEEKLSRDFVHDLFPVAAQHGHAHIVRLFVELGFDLERFPEVGHSASRMAAEEGYFSIARMLVELGVSVDGKGGEWSLVVAAQQYGRMTWWHFWFNWELKAWWRDGTIVVRY